MTWAQYAVARVAAQFRAKLLRGQKLTEQEQAVNGFCRDAVLKYEAAEKRGGANHLPKTEGVTSNGLHIVRTE